VESGIGGVNLDLGNACSDNALSWARKTFQNRSGELGAPELSFDRAFSTILNFDGVKIAITSDGIGTKIELAERVDTYDTLGFDLVAMVVDDLAAIGAQPVGLSNVLDVDRMDYAIIDRLMKGLCDAAKVAGVVVTGGEIAELGNRVHGWGKRMHFNWCATGIGVLPEGTTPVDGVNVSPGNVVITLGSRGFRCNGFTLVRSIMQKTFGKKWHQEPYDDQACWGEMLLTPSLVFSPVISGLITEGISVTGIAHITGGGIPDNLCRVLKTNRLGATLDTLYPPHPPMRRIQVLGDIAEELAYRQWNMGNGMLLLVAEAEGKQCLETIADSGYMAQVAGHITDTPLIRIRSAGCDPQLLEYAIDKPSSEA